MDLTREAKIHAMLQVPKLRAALDALEKIDTSAEDGMFARKLGEVILACDVFVDNTKHQHRTICNVMKGRRA